MNTIYKISTLALLVSASYVNAATLTIDSAKDWGNGSSSYPASNAIDGSLSWASRWAASGSPVNLQLNLASVEKITEVGVSWGRGGERTFTFEIWARAGTSGDWTKVYDDLSSGSTSSIEVYDITDIDAQQVRIKTFENSAGTDWTDIKEVEVYGSSSSSDDGELTISTIFDDGTSSSNYPASNAIDNSTAWSSRWAAEDDGGAVNLTAQFDEIKDVTEVGIAWGQGSSRTHTFELYGRSGTSGSWTKIFDSVSSGDTSNIEVYDVTNISAKQIRVKAQSNSAGSDWMNITELKIYGGDSDEDDTTTPEIPVGDASYPSDLMDNYDQWKITYPDGVEDKTLYHESNEYFYVNDTGNGIVFKTPIRSDNDSTKNSDNIRSELREREADGSGDIYWTTDGTHVVYSKQAITHLPIVVDKLVATQIHGNKEDKIDDAMVLRLEGEHLFLCFNGGDLRDDITIKTDYKLGTVHEVIFEVINGKHYAYYSENGDLSEKYLAGNADAYLIKDGSKNYVMDLDYDESYFKIGNYTQSNPSKEGDYTGDLDNYGEVVVYDFWVDHD